MELGRVGIWTASLGGLSVAQAGDTAAELESLGYGAIWLPEAVTADPFVLATLLLRATSRIVLATGIASIYARDPLAMNAGWRTISAAFPERFLLGLGVSHQPMVEGVRKHTYGPPLQAMREYLDGMDAAPFFGAPIDGQGPYRCLAALGPKMLELAAARTRGAHPYFQTPEHTARARAAMGSGAWLMPEQMCVLTTDAAAARAVARANMAIYLNLPNYTNNLRRLGYDDADLADGGSDRLVDAIVVWGDEATVAARVAEHHAAGADHVCVQVLAADRASVPLESWRRLAPALTG
jgi:probable F420-dependent oxidoreductase